MQADFLTGVSLLKREDENLYEYWVSFSPLAPFFGVPWRFAPTMQAGLAFGTPEASPAPQPKPAPAKPTRTARAKPAPSEVEDAEAVEPKATSVAEAPTTKPEAAGTPAPAETTPGASVAEAPVPAEAEATPRAKPAVLMDEAPAQPDDLKRIKGVGPKLEAELNGLGIWTFSQVAALSLGDLEWVDENLTSFKGRSVRDDWVGQAKALLGE